MEQPNININLYELLGGGGEYSYSQDLVSALQDYDIEFYMGEPMLPYVHHKITKGLEYFLTMVAHRCLKYGILKGDNHCFIIGMFSQLRGGTRLFLVLEHKIQNNDSPVSSNAVRFVSSNIDTFKQIHADYTQVIHDITERKSEGKVVPFSSGNWKRLDELLNRLEFREDALNYINNQLDNPIG